MVPYQTPIIAEKDSVIKVTVATGKPCKNTPYFNFSCSYLKNEFGDPNLFISKM